MTGRVRPWSDARTSRASGRALWGSGTEHLRAVEQSRSFAELRRDPMARRPFSEMAGPEVFRWAIGAVAGVCGQAPRAAGVTVRDI